MSIADTACAKSRPLGANVYESLRRLGAAADMPAIEYRQAWALVGFKGAQPGTAVHSMGMRSTLLRVSQSINLSLARSLSRSVAQLLSHLLSQKSLSHSAYLLHFRWTAFATFKN